MTSPKQRHHRVADRVRAHFGTPATVSSGVRCHAHNDELPGSTKNSYHVKGKAMDFCVRGVSGAKLLVLLALGQKRTAPGRRPVPLHLRPGRGRI